MGSGIFFPISAVAFSILMIILFYSKEVIKSFETSIYKYLLIVNFFGLALEIGCTYAAYISSTNPFLSDFILKLYLVYNVLWTLLLTIYVVYISMPNASFVKWKKILKPISIIGFLITVFLIYISKCNLIIENNFQTRYTTGPSVTLTYVASSLLIFIIILAICFNKKSFKSKKYIPVYIFIVTIVIGIIIQSSIPGLLIMTYIETFTLNIMYHTIENPDIKVMSELYKNKELVESTFVDKSNFLFEMTGEVREPLSKINNLCTALSQEDNVEKLKSGMEVIKHNCKQLDFIVNDVLNVNSLDIQKIKIINKNYNIYNLFNELVSKTKSIIQDGVEFRSRICDNIPLLYGDSVILRQIVYSLLASSCEKTKNGFVDFNIDTIEKYEACRLIITIKDSGSGMDINTINDILAATGELNQEDLKNLEKMKINLNLCQKIVKLFGANLMIKSEVGKGSEIILILDQKKEITNEQSVLTEFEKYLHQKKVLVVVQDKELLKIIDSKFSQKDIVVVSMLNGNSAIDNVRAGKKYDYIIVQDDMKNNSGYSVLKELQKIQGFNIPVVIILNENRENIQNHYLDDGFSDCLLTSKLNAEINRIISKF